MNKANALVVVDFQKDFVSGALGFEAAQKIEEKLRGKIIDHWRNGGTVIFTYDTHETDYMNTNEGKNLPVPHCIIGTPGWELTDQIKMAHDWGVRNGYPCYDIQKPTFGSLGLINVINDLVESTDGESGVTLEFTGVVTNICVISNAVVAKATAPDANIIVNKGLCASNDPELEQKAYDILRNLHIEVK